MIVDVALTEPQRKFCLSESPYPAIVGGLGSGKSAAGTMRLVLLLLQDKGANGAYYMPTYDLIKLRAMPGLEQDLAKIGIDFTINKSDFSIQLGSGYGKVIFRSYDRPERIIAYEVAHSICDELDTLVKEKASWVWRKISERNRQKRAIPNTIGLVTTPDQGMNGFVYERWVKKQQSGYELIKASTYSNPFLPAGYADQILANYDESLAKLYLEGEFVNLTANKVYHFYERERHKTNREILGTDSLHIGLDFNVGGCCAVCFIIDGDNIHAVNEFTSYDTQDFINRLAQFNNVEITVYPDASGNNRKTNASESDIAMIKRAGYEVRHNQMNPAVRDRINAVNGLLSHNRLLVNHDKCPELATALESQGYDKKGDPEKFDTHPSIDDWNDSMGYFIAYKFPIRVDRIVPKQQQIINPYGYSWQA